MHPTFTKKISGFVLHLCLPALVFLSFQGSGQVFWSEDFGTGCNTGTLAYNIVTANGTWTVDSSMGFNETYANQWFISAHTNNNGAGNCANDCAGGNNQTLHIGNPAVSGVGLAAEQVSYLNGFFCSSGFCSSTHKRMESPLIDCSGKNGISLDFLYYEGGDVGNLNGDATIWYFDGSVWSEIDTLQKTANAGCNATIYGNWTSHTIALPASADNNPGIKLGFQWDNDESNTGSDPSAAFDNIRLSLPGLVADFSASDTDICVGDAIDFTDLTTNSPTAWLWTFAGGSPATSTAQNPTGIVYNIAGSYTVTLYVTNANDSDTLTVSNYITVNACAIPVANFLANNTTICTGDAVDFTDQSSNSPTSWEWTFFGASPASSTAQNPTGIVYSSSGSYNVQLIVTNTYGSDTLLFSNYISVSVCAPPVANFIATDTSLCVGDSISFFNLSTNNPTSFQWTFFGATPPVSSVQNPTGIFYNTPGVYTVQLIVSNGSGSDTLVMTNYINVNACIPPTAAYSASQTTICEGFCIDFSDQSFGTPTSWLWLFPGSNVVSSALQNPTNICYADSGTFNVTLIVRNDYGTDTLLKVAYITVDTCPKPRVHFMASDTFFCSTNCIDFTDLSDNIDGTTSWHWIFPGGDPSEDSVRNPHVCYPDEGVFDAILIETNQYGSDTLILSQYISVINVPGSYISNDTSIYFGNTVQLHAGGGVAYQWSSQVPGSTFLPSETDPNPLVIPFSSPPEQTYTYYCEITDSTTGCKTVKQVTVEILHTDNIFVPNSFKPSSSGANSTVGVYATNVKSLTFSIYDKWGEKVFESHNPCPDTGPCDPSGWDGKYKGVDCEMGTYVYTLFIITEGGNIFHKNGNITLIR